MENTDAVKRGLKPQEGKVVRKDGKKLEKQRKDVSQIVADLNVQKDISRWLQDQMRNFKV